MNIADLFYILGFIALLLVVSNFMHEDKKFKKEKLVKRCTNTIKYKCENDDYKTFLNIISFLENEVFFRYGKNKLEKNYQDDLFHRFAVLEERYGYQTDYESTKGNNRIDFLINNSIGVELKIYRGGTQVHKELFNQISTYAHHFPKIIGVVLNLTDKPNNDLKLEIKNKLKDQNVITEEDYEIIIISVKRRD